MVASLQQCGSAPSMVAVFTLQSLFGIILSTRVALSWKLFATVAQTMILLCQAIALGDGQAQSHTHATLDHRCSQ